MNEKGGKVSLKKKQHTQKKGEDTRMEKHTENNEKGGKERVKRRFLQRKNFFISQNIFFFCKKKKNNQDTKGFLKTLRKRGKENENKKKERNREKLEKTKICKWYKERENRENIFL